MTFTRFVWPLRDWLNARDARRLARRRELPATIERSYWHSIEYAKDAARLESLGYSEASEADNDPYVRASLPAAAGGVSGQLGRTVERRVPSMHVIYQRRFATPEGDAKPGVG